MSVCDQICLFSISSDESEPEGEKVFTITVDGPLSGPPKIYMEIYRLSNHNFDVRYVTSSLNILCESCSSYYKAMKKLNSLMKLAMKGELICQTCWRCDNVCWYPSITCEMCGEYCMKDEWTTEKKMKKNKLEKKI